MIDRRHLLGLGLGLGLTACAAPGLARAESADPIGDLLTSLDTAPRRLKLLNLHTMESADTVYWENGAYSPEGLAALNTVLRDFRTGDVFQMDTGLYDTIHALAARVESDQPFQIVSGYRSPKTNAMLRDKSTQVAENSVHTLGAAVDLYLDNVALTDLHAAALSLRAGGVGLYPVTGFIHVDTGRLRRWRGT